MKNTWLKHNSKKAIETKIEALLLDVEALEMAWINMNNNIMIKIASITGMYPLINTIVIKLLKVMLLLNLCLTYENTKMPNAMISHA